MRTNSEENTHLGQVVSNRLRENIRSDTEEKIHVFIPLKSVSLIDQEGGVFHDSEADQALFQEIRNGLCGSSIGVTEMDSDINDPVFAEAMAKKLLELMY